jgi:hypothetical protein
LNDALLSNVAVYPVDARGPIPVIPFGDAESQTYSFGRDQPPATGPSMLANMSARGSVLAAEKMSLDYVARQTGGRSLVGNNDLKKAFHMLREDRNGYEIGYYLSDLKSDGSYHQIDIKVQRAGVTTLSKLGYYAPIPFEELSRARKRDWLYEALLANRPLTDINMSGRVDIFPNPRRDVFSVPITVDMNWWVERDVAERQHQWLLIVGVLEDRHGSPIKAFTSTNFWKPSPSDSSDIAEYGLRRANYNILAYLTSGVYRLKIAAADLDTNQLGSKEFIFEIPDPSSGLVSSSLVLTDELFPVESRAGSSVDYLNGAGLKDNPPPDPLVFEGNRLLPSTFPVFGSGGSLYLFMRFLPKQTHNVEERYEITALLRSLDGRVVAGPFTVPLSPTQLQQASIPVLFQFDLDRFRLKPDTYKAEYEFVERSTKERHVYSQQFVLKR